MPTSHRQKFLLPIVFFLLLLFMAGCEKNDEKQQAAAVDAPKTILRIGLIPEHNIFAQKERYAPLARYLSEKNNVTIELKMLSRYGNIIDNFVSSELDGAFFGSFTGALAHKKLNIEALARPENFDSQSTYYGLIFVRKDSGIKNGADMRGKRFAFVDKATTAGWLLPLYYFKTENINDFRTWFSETYFTGTHEDAILDVLDGKADVGAAKNTVFDRLKKSNQRISDELTVLAISPPVPANSLLVRKDLDSVLKNKLRESLLLMDITPEGQQILKNFGATRFIETNELDYKPVFDFAEIIGLDLATYNYIND